MPECIDALGTPLCPHAPTDQTATLWEFQVEKAPLAVWDWENGSPPVRRLGPVRRPRSTAKSRHAPVLACSYTTGTMLHLESGLELDLVRALDRLTEVDWIVPQHARLRFDRRLGSRKIEHIPDLLTVDSHGSVTVWDVRAETRRDAKFQLQSSMTADACEHHGWRYRLFSELPGVMRINIMWLNNYRRMQPWYAGAATEIRALVGVDGAPVCAVLDADRGSGHLVSTMWHLIWTGDLACDLADRIGVSTLLRVAR